MFRLDLLPYWNVTNLKPAFYDVESCSAIGQTARVYGAMNKLIESYNEWINQVNKSILEFNESTDQDIDCFKRGITELCNNYIKTMDMKIEHQDREIQESITYIKENITASVRDVVNEMKESGELAEELLATFEELSQKVNGLETFLNGEAEKIVLLTQDNETNKTDISNLKVDNETNKTDISNLKVDNETNKTRLDNLVIYSTEETFTGKYWIDGKPLYRKVIKITNYTKNSLTNVNHNIPNIDFVMIKDAFITMDQTAMTRTMNYFQSFTQNTVQAGKEQINYFCNVTDYDNLFFILEYTKTTD